MARSFGLIHVVGVCEDGNLARLRIDFQDIVFGIIGDVHEPGPIEDDAVADALVRQTDPALRLAVGRDAADGSLLGEVDGIDIARLVAGGAFNARREFHGFGQRAGLEEFFLGRRREQGAQQIRAQNGTVHGTSYAINFLLLLLRNMRRSAGSEKVVFRSAKERSFAERKTTLRRGRVKYSFGDLGSRQSVAQTLHAGSGHLGAVHLDLFEVLQADQMIHGGVGHFSQAADRQLFEVRQVADAAPGRRRPRGRNRD